MSWKDGREARPLPQSTVQAAGQAASEVISGLKQQPIVLALVVLVIVGVAVQTWFLSSLVAHSTARFTAIEAQFSKLMEFCLVYQLGSGP